jgi:LPS sulfotransferase NodH
VNPLRLRYETLAERPAETLIDICKILGVKPPEAHAVTPDLTKLADALSFEWARRYELDILHQSASAPARPSLLDP